jgi:hypothetical protein
MDQPVEKINGHDLSHAKSKADWEAKRAQARAALGERALKALLDLYHVMHDLAAHEPGDEDSDS